MIDLIVKLLYLVGFSTGALLVTYSGGILMSGGGQGEEDILASQLFIGFGLLWMVFVW